MAGRGMLEWGMAKKIRESALQEWLLKGNVEMLDKYWKHPEMVAYRARELVSTLYQKPEQNPWCENFRNGKTFVFLLERDPEVQKAHKDLVHVDYWSNLFLHRCWRDSWAMLDVGPEHLRQALALPTLDGLMRAKHTADGEYENMNGVRAKVYNELHAFYRTFEHRYPLTALAWVDNESFWSSQRPMMANLMRYAASHHPEDILGAYLVWANNVGLGTKQEEKERLASNALRMAQLQDLAGRVGLDTASYDDHRRNCTTLYAGLGIELSGQSVLEYVRSVGMPAAIHLDELDTPSLFV